MSPLLRRLSGTRRRSHADLEHALEAAETDRDIARAEKASAYEAIGKIAVAAGRPGAPTRWNVEDLVDWALEAHSWRTRHTRMVQQAEAFEAELIAVDGALAELGAGPADDRIEAIRNLTRGTDRDPSRREAGQLADDGVVDAEIACGRTCVVEVNCGDDEHHDGPCWPSPYSLAQRALNGAAVNRPHLLEHMRAVWSAIVNAPSGEVFVVGQVWLTQVLAAAQHTSGEPLSLEDVLTLVRGLEQRRVDAVRQGTAIARNLDRTQAQLRGVRERVRAAVDPWCLADLDGVACDLPAGHVEPCHPAEQVVTMRLTDQPGGAELAEQIRARLEHLPRDGVV